MKLLIFNDLHLVSPADRDLSHQQKRPHFTEARRCLPALTREIKEAAPDLIISLGDLVGWYSDENRDFALAFLHGLHTPWVMTPGNHDRESPPGVENLGGWRVGRVRVSKPATVNSISITCAGIASTATTAVFCSARRAG